MKKSNLHLMLAITLSVLFLSCQKDEVLSENTILHTNAIGTKSQYSKVEFSLVQSANYDLASQQIVGLKKFNSKDNQIGAVSTNDNISYANALITNNSDVIVFENNLPESIKNISKSELLNKINQIEWTQSAFKYSQPLDIIERVESNGLKLSVREAGNFGRDEAMFENQKIYKFKNNVYTEDYRALTDLLDEYTTTDKVVDMTEKLQLNKADYQVSSTSEWFKVVDKNVVFIQAETKPTNTFGIIYFKPLKADLPTYRIRVFYHRVPQNIKETYFQNGKVIDVDKYHKEYFKAIVDTNTPTCLFLTKTAREMEDASHCPPGGSGGN